MAAAAKVCSVMRKKVFKYRINGKKKGKFSILLWWKERSGNFYEKNSTIFLVFKSFNSKKKIFFKI